VVKRFYKEARPIPLDGGFGVALDAKPIKTPLKAPLVVPSEGLAGAIAGEWNAQRESVAREALRLTRLACTALDRATRQRDALLDELAGYAETDLLCYRAERPASLVERQAAAWDPLLAWAAEAHGAALAVTRGVTPVEQPAKAVARLRAAADALDVFRLTALHLATGASGSLVLALALVAGRLDADAAFLASQIDESFQIEQWGADAEFEARRAAFRADLAAAAEAVRLLGA
jgi:chaperone required for assembly of F1-ATPase